MLRVAGLPIETVDRLRCPESRRWAEEVLEHAERLRAEGERIGDLLYELVGGCQDDTTRRALLACRREVFNNRLPRDPEAVAELVTGLRPDTGQRLTAWLADRRRLTDRERRGADVLAAELAGTRAELRGIVEDERLRAGLLLASPTLGDQLDVFVRKGAAEPHRAPDKRMRKVERSLLSYLYRTACKTSPFSTFTGVATGTLTAARDGAAGGGEDLAAGRTLRFAARWSSHPRLNVVALGRLTEAVVADPARRADLPVSLASGWGRDHDRVRYVRRWVTAGDDDTAVTFDAVKDRLFFLRRSGTLERMLVLFEGRPTLRYGELTRWLAAEQDASEADCARYLEALLDLGMLQVPVLGTQVHDTDPLRAFQSALRVLDRAWADELAATLDGPISRVDRYATADVTERRRLLAELRDELHVIQRQLGVAEPRVPRTLLYEDATAGTDTRCDADSWAELVAEPLRGVERVLPAFDLTLPQRITLKGFFLARYGQGNRCADLLKLVHDFHEDFFDQYLTFSARRVPYDAEGRYTPEENWLGLPQLKALDTARQTFTEGLRRRWADTPPDAAELRLDERLLDQVAEELASVTPRFAPQSHHVQLAERPDDPLVVLNRSYGGLAFPFSRFTHCFPGMAEELRADSRCVQPPGAVLAEVTGGPVTSNLNLHDRLTDYEIVCPGERGSLPPDRQLALEDLYLEHDSVADRLVLRSIRLDREVIPVYLGYLVPLALPEVPRTLLMLSPTSMAPLSLWDGVPAGEPIDGVTSRPRLRHGSVVLSRRSWSAPASVLPLRAARDTDESWFLGWQRWRRTHGLPARVFANVTDSAARGATGAKPQYVDLDSYLSLTAFEALLRSAEARVVFREMLPDEDSLHVVSEQGRHVAELAVETRVATRGAEEA
ncbi:lantibiotic dehydratase [Streptomyces oceani]|uniref:Lantibiotic dehydratase n=1 Tax=Streptomyces oceani TaxID=1075402 RepID=A0A1E7KK86_9ACTN|nr:lantibiotic dehydratase [Streptomyces oceani]OEV04348.1 lantibiotic dehydratase [Streptomyces oceani]